MTTKTCVFLLRLTFGSWYIRKYTRQQQTDLALPEKLELGLQNNLYYQYYLSVDYLFKLPDYLFKSVKC